MILTCKNCQSQFPNVDSFVLHFELSHKVTSLSNFHCGFEDCFIPSHNLGSYKRHISAFHSSEVEGTAGVCQSTVKVYECAFCNFSCSVASTLRSHRKRKHDSDDLPELPRGSNALDVCDIEMHDESSFLSQDIVEENGQPVQPPTDQGSLEPVGPSLAERRELVGEKISNFYMSLNSVHHIPESTIQHMINTHHSVHKEAGHILTEELVNKLMEFNFAAPENLNMVKSSVNEVVHSSVVAVMHDPHGPLRSMHMRRKAYHSGQRYIQPKAFKLGLNDCNDKRVGHYIDIGASLQSLLEDDSIWDQYVQTEASGCSTDGMIRDIYDGSLVKNHPVLSKDSSALGIMLYQDDLEIANALGAAKGKHKITAVYFTLSNLKTWSRMNVRIIRLALIVAEKDVSYFGLKRSMKPLLKDLLEYEKNGIVVRGKKLRVVLLNLLGDNLGTHMFIGLVENFRRSKYFCRYCEESREEWKQRWNGQNLEICDDSDIDSESDSDADSLSDSEDDEPNEECFQQGEDDNTRFDNEFDKKIDSLIVPPPSAPFRTPESYDKCLQQLEKRTSVDSVKGVVGKCPLNDLENFHCIGSCPPCIAHDMFEGVIAYDLALAINHFVASYSSITIDYINRKLKSLKLKGSDQGDKPAFVKAGMKKLRGNAVQNWHFLRFLPLIIGEKVRKSDPVWRMVLKLIEITRILTSPAIARSSVPVAKRDINVYLKMRVTCFPKVGLRPKHHFLEHDAELIERFGCLMRVGTLGCESKHRFFKNAASAKKNFKNITKTLAEEHQLADSAQSVDHLVSSFPIPQNPAPFHSVHLSTTLHNHILSFFGLDYLKASAVAEKVRFRGTWYSKGEAVVTSWKSKLHAELCLVELLVFNGKNCYICGQSCKAELNPDLQIYIIEKLPKYCVANIERVPDYVSYPVYARNYQEIVLLKHIVVPPKN